MDPQAPSNLPTGQDISFQVMPRDGGAPASYGPPQAPPPPSSLSPLSVEPETSFFRTWKFYTLIAVAAALILGVAGWFLFGSEKPSDDDQQAVTKLPKVWLKQYFDKEVCDDKGICGDEADPDSDGLKNYEEFKTGTSPVNNDSDADGLADGDEVLIFKTEATLKFTDRRDIVAQNNWTDGIQIRNGYDPVTPGLKFTELRNKQIFDDKARLGFHEPTITTLGESSTTQDLKTYSNPTLGIEFNYPSKLFAEDTDDTFRIRSSALKVYDGGGVQPEGEEGKDWVKGYEIYLSKAESKDVSLVSKDDYQVTKLNYANLEVYDISADVPSSGPDIYIKNPNKANTFIRVGYHNGLTTSDEVDKVFQEILRSFKFTK